ncbi:hypothetical protein PHSY_002491 [Pseudozyma hubeiensis SY62]|uniref:Uncharacterized protein n=1 Tax=Pseudozyma hubeiensis (strain SY62) TaxID=1305764 RepID=R9P0Z3_PSEHS|nr:hypothetical protein PHSY_002491 [Pseudozyma hubeiensis SY62]GAC94918.1 hypothetical protein PHSY_002491 [Pseudozyma hubeiensis SY62]
MSERAAGIECKGPGKQRRMNTLSLAQQTTQRVFATIDDPEKEMPHTSMPIEESKGRSHSWLDKQNLSKNCGARRFSTPRGCEDAFRVYGPVERTDFLGLGHKGSAWHDKAKAVL